MTQPVVIYAEFTALAPHIARVKELLASFARQVQAEPGNIVFAPHQLESDPSKFFVYEKYDGQEAFDAHLSSAHTADFSRGLVPLIVEDAAQIRLLSDDLSH